ncbi:uncharacterized protein LOC109143933 isoform X1 [Corvus cornix cornix]|uniref:uncharacterized protein LOC109143933 isoform X1 n=2 Tax=Corvus cornix cornix TaxID=932674 RepID=UPI00194FB199|nr:uncharacterized protein LOC109143933 isoform X1 [Corvus cornix cornix]
MCPVPGPCISYPAAPATISLLPSSTEPLLSLLLVQAMAGRITKILLVLAILQYGLRADAQAVKATEEVLTQHEEQPNQEMTWLAMAASITKILMVAGIFQYTLSVDLPAVKVTEELLRQHEEQRSQEMAKLQKMEHRMEEQRMQEQSILLSACQQWWFWDCVEIILTLFGIYWLPSQRRAGSDSGSQGKTTWSAQEQMEEEDKPLGKSWALRRIC